MYKSKNIITNSTWFIYNIDSKSKKKPIKIFIGNLKYHLITIAICELCKILEKELVTCDLPGLIYSQKKCFLLQYDRYFKSSEAGRNLSHYQVPASIFF